MSNESNILVVKKSTLTASPTPTPSPTSSPTSTPSPTPTPTPLPSLIKRIDIKFEWNELNRANEILSFFDNNITNFLKRAGVDPKLMAEMRLILSIKLSEVILRKYQSTLTSVNLETAINIIDEQLPKLIKNSNSLDVEQLLNTWSSIKKLITSSRGDQK
jgi:hypothetical protein